MVQFRWRNFFRPFNATFNADATSKEEELDHSDDDDLPWSSVAAGDVGVHELCSQVLESVVARVEGRKGNPTLPVAALARRLPEEDAANELFQLATLDRNPYKRELQAALGHAGVISALAAALCGDGTPQAKQWAALALCAMGRNSPTNRQAIKSEAEEVLANCIRAGNADISCVALVLDVLLQGDIFSPTGVIDMVAAFSDSDPSDLELQCRSAMVLQSLVQAGAIDKALLRKRELQLLCSEWSELLARFLAAETEDDRLQSQFHADMQAVFHEEVVRRFECEAAERCIQMQLKAAGAGRECLLDVIRCYVENLEDYQARLQARDFGWEADQQQLVPLDGPLCERMSQEVCRRMEPGFILALQAAAVDGGPQSTLTRRHARLRSECTTLLDLKTKATQEHQEQAIKRCREVVLFQVTKYLESSVLAVSTTQVRTALSMFKVVEATAPADAVERLRERLNCLATSHNVAKKA